MPHFERYRMRRSDVDSTILGDAYEYLIAKFADDAARGRRARPRRWCA